MPQDALQLARHAAHPGAPRGAHPGTRPAAAEQQPGLSPSVAAGGLVAALVVCVWLAEVIPAGTAVPAGGALALALFIPVLCALSLVMKERRSHTRRIAAQNTDRLAETQYFQIYQRNPLPSIIRQAWFPVLVIALINLYFTGLLIYTPALDEAGYGNILLLGHLFMAHDPGGDAYLRQAMSAMCFAYLGWYVWTVSTIFARLVTMELVAATYYSVLTRLVVAVFVALMFNHLRAAFPRAGGSVLPEAIGFGVGLFPDSALVALSVWLRRLLLRTDERLEEFPLDLIQGVSPYRKLRLFEMGLDNCENLAAANAVELFLTSNLKLVEVVDWIGQAQLAILVGSENFIRLQRHGYRTAIDFHRGCRSAARAVLGGLLCFQDAQLTDLADGMEQDPSYESLIELRGHLREPLSPNAVPMRELPREG